MKPLLPTLLIALIMAAQATPASAQEDERDKNFYRVEAIVFTHAGGDADAWPVDELPDRSSGTDPEWREFARQQALARAETDSDSAESELETALNVVDTIANLESGEASLTEALLYPEPWLALEDLSEPMARAMTRFERSGGYRILATLAWHQPLDRESASRAVRIHDDRPIAVDWITVTPTGRLLRGGRPVENVEQLAPVVHFRTDGSIRLRQRQFMHADVVLEWRVQEAAGPSAWPIAPPRSKLAVHRLEQSRTVRPGRFEYFDSEWLGLLLRITPYEVDRPGEGEPDNGDAETDPS
jgi:hypothetical protein